MSSLSLSSHRPSFASAVSAVSSVSAPSSPSVSQSINSTLLCKLNDTKNTDKSKCRRSSFLVQSTSLLFAKDEQSTDANILSITAHHGNFSTLRRCRSLTTLVSTTHDKNNDDGVPVELQHTYKTAARLRRASRAIPAAEMGNSQPTHPVSPIEPRTSPNWLVGRYIGNDYDFLYKAPIRQFFAKNALEPDDALLFPLYSQPQPVLPHHRWMRPLVPLLRFDSGQIGSAMEDEFPRPDGQQRRHRPNLMADMNWLERFHYVFTTGLFDCLRHRCTR
jgi:hypothetical protein